MRTRALASMRVVALTAAALVLTACGETEEYEVEVGFRGLARAEPFLAAERTFEDWGRAAGSRRSFEVPGDDVAFVLTSADALAADLPVTERTRAWVGGGGHLVLTLFGAERPGSPAYAELGTHALLDPLGVEASDDDLLDIRPFASEFSDEADDWDVDFASVRGEGVFDPIAASFARTGHVELTGGGAVGPDGELWRSSTDDRYGVSFELGRGRLTVLANGSFASNHGIDEGENPELLWRLHELSRPGEAWFVMGGDRTLLELLWERAAHFVVAAVALVVAWLWRSTRRFGPPVTPLGRERHAFGDHVVASGRFLWRRVGGGAIVEPLRRRVLRAAQRSSLGTVSDAAQQERLVEALHERSGLEPTRVRAALFDAVTDDSDSLVAMVRDLHTLERAHD